MTTPAIQPNVAENAALEQAERELKGMTAGDLLDLQRYILHLEESAGITGTARTTLRGPKDSLVEFSATAATPVAAYQLLQEAVKEMLGKGFTLVIETGSSTQASPTMPTVQQPATYPQPAQAGQPAPASASTPPGTISEFPITFVRHEVAKNGTHIVRVKGGNMVSFGVAAYPETLQRYPQFATYLEWPINIDLSPAEKTPGLTVAVIQQGEKYSKVVEFK